jgi:hypothetical protein
MSPSHDPESVVEIALKEKKSMASNLRVIDMVGFSIAEKKKTSVRPLLYRDGNTLYNGLSLTTFLALLYSSSILFSKLTQYAYRPKEKRVIKIAL